MRLTHPQLRRQAIAQAFPPASGLRAAIARLGFVQADPIRAPARAQDLILRQRVRAYRVGDLERRYASLDLEEDLLYAYGFMPREVWTLQAAVNRRAMTPLEKRVLAAVNARGEAHSRALDGEFGPARVVNAWGGYSKATKQALETLHRRGLLRVARREAGIRIYAAVDPTPPAEPSMERFRRLVGLCAQLFAPSPIKTLHRVLAPVRRRIGIKQSARVFVREMLASGELRGGELDGVTFVWPPSSLARTTAPPIVRLLAPFDPLVWDRTRFEQLWGWPYRFEAYTPPAKRIRGYYAMPMLWGEHIIGWANVSVVEGVLNVTPGYIRAPPKGRDFRAAFDAEVQRMGKFLRLGD